MGLLPYHCDLEPALALRALHHTDGLLLGLQDRALLDMRLEEREDVTPADLLRPVIADALQLCAHGLAVEVGARQAVFQREHAGENAGRDHRGREARALLVGPDRDLDRPLGLVVEIVQRAHDLEAGHDAVDAVELAPRGLAVDVAAGHHGRKRIVLARAAREDVAHLVDLDGAAGILRPLAEQIARLLVEIGEGQAADAALLGGADFRHLHEAVPQPIGVDAQIGSQDEPPRMSALRTLAALRILTRRA
jgi:hypothetical protein